VRDWLGTTTLAHVADLRRNGVQQLTGMDASFLALETANATGHVGGLSVLDPSTAAEPLTLVGYLPQELALLAEAAEERAAKQIER